MTRKSGLQHEIQQRPPFRSEAQEATIAILRTADVVRRRLAAVVEPHGITFQQYNVLRILRGARPDPLSTQEIGERLIEQTPGVTRLLDRLEARALVSRQRCADDRRLVHTHITKSGMELLSRMDASMDTADDAAVAMLSASQVRTLIRVLERVRSME